MEEYSSNSYKSKENQIQQKERLQPVVSSGAVKMKKKSGMRKFMDAFIQEDKETIKQTILKDIVIPGLKNALWNSVGAILFGNGGYGGGGGSYTNYVNYSKPKVNGIAYNNNGKSSNYIKSQIIEFEDVIFNNPQAAEEVRRLLCQRVDQYGLASWLDLYDLSGCTDIPYTADKYGWTDLRASQVVRIGDGWIIKLPKALPLN